MRRILPFLAVLIVGCGASGATSTSAGVSTIPSTVAETTTSAPPGMGCPLDEDFVGSGRIARITQPSSDSRTLGLISVNTSEGCERIGFNFETVENAPATTPPSVDAEFLNDGRIVRIHLDIDQTVITDQLIETDLADRLYVVKSLDGDFFVDIHLATPASARVSVSNSPAGLSLELSPRQGELGPAVAISRRVVLMAPTENDTVVGPDVDVTGYARVFEGNVLVLATTGGTVVGQTSTQAADWVDTWGEFEATLTLQPGTIDLFVGEESPEDGSLDGVTLRLEVQ